MKRPAANWKTFAVDIWPIFPAAQNRKVHWVKGRVVCGKTRDRLPMFATPSLCVVLEWACTWGDYA